MEGVAEHDKIDSDGSSASNVCVKNQASEFFNKKYKSSSKFYSSRYCSDNLKQKYERKTYPAKIRYEKVSDLVPHFTNMEGAQEKGCKISKSWHWRHVGKVLILYRNENGEFFVIGPHWHFAVAMLLFLLGVTIFCLFWVYPRIESWFYYSIGVISAVFTVVNFVICVVKDPGIIVLSSTYTEISLFDKNRAKNNIHEMSLAEGGLSNDGKSLNISNGCNINSDDRSLFPKLEENSKIYPDSKGVESGDLLICGITVDKNSDDISVWSDSSCISECSIDSDLHRKICRKCHIFVPKGAHHCDDCEVCIGGYDHHCPWTSKCVGRKNIIYFYLWVATSIISVVYTILLVGANIPPFPSPVHGLV